MFLSLAYYISDVSSIILYYAAHIFNIKLIVFLLCTFFVYEWIGVSLEYLDYLLLLLGSSAPCPKKVSPLQV